MTNTIIAKEKTIEHHRQMWNWIAHKCEENSKLGLSITDMMVFYCNENNIKGVDPCCVYNIMVLSVLGLVNQCQFCPILWGTENKCKASYCTCSGRGLFAKVVDAEYLKQYVKVKEIALQIANLPERLIDNDENKNLIEW